MAVKHDICRATGAASRAIGVVGLTLAACLQIHPIVARANPDPLPVDTQSSPATSQYEQQKQLAEAQKAAFEAQKAAIEAETAQLQAELARTKLSLSGGLTAPTPPASAIAFGGNPGKAEATLLHARAMKAAGEEIGTQLCRLPNATGVTLVLVGDQQIDLSRFLAFKADTASIEGQLNTARTAIGTANSRYRALPRAAFGAGSARNFATIMAGADAALGGIAKLASYFNAKYTFGEAVPEKDPALLSAAIACPGMTFIIPGNIPATSASKVFETLANLEASAATLRQEAAAARQNASRIAESDNAQAQVVSAEFTSVLSYADSALQRFDAFASALGATTSGEGKPAGTAPVAQIAREEFIDAKLNQSGTRILALRPVSAGAYYTKESLWSFLAGPPLKSMGGAAVAYSLQDAQSGQVVKSGTVIFHGGYRSVRAVEKLFPKIN